jgi:hypothetical protein
VASYYARRAARDPAWREAQLAAAAEREARRRERDPEGLRAARREATARCRERQAAHGLTLAQLERACLLDTYPRPRETLARVLRELVASGVVDYHSTSRRYQLNGGLDAETVAALRQLELSGVEGSVATVAVGR